MAAEVTVTYRKRRNVELAMVLLAQILGAGGYVLTHLFRDARLPGEWPYVVGAWVLIGLVAHLVVRFTMPYADPVMLPIVLLLNGLGLAMIHRLDLATVPPGSDAVTQFVWTCVAVVGFAATILAIRDPERLHRFPYILFLVGVVLLLLPLVPGLGRTNYGATIWISIAGYSFQPAEIAKIVLAIAFASYLADRRTVLAQAGHRFLGVELPRARDLGPVLLMWGASLIVLVAESDLGTSLLFFGLFVMMLYVATEKIAWPILGGLLFVGGALLAYQLFGHVRVRVSSWLDPFSDFQQNYQIIQGQFGMAWGGLFGRGWGLGSPSLTPLAKSDFIATAIGEELGTVGLMAVIVLYALLVTRGLRTALTVTEPFLKLLSAGLAFVVALQVFAIIGGVTRLLPLTGLTTPFMSQGGSSLLANWVVLALMLMVSHIARKPRPEPVAGPVEVSLAADATQAIPVQRLPRSPITPDDPAAAAPTVPLGAGAKTEIVAGSGRSSDAVDPDAPTSYIAVPDAPTSQIVSPDAPTTYIPGIGAPGPDVSATGIPDTQRPHTAATPESAPEPGQDAPPSPLPDPDATRQVPRIGGDQ